MRQVVRWLPNLLMAVLAAALGVLGAYWQAWQEQSDRAHILAGVVLERAEQTSDQMTEAFEKMARFGPDEACSRESITAMRRIDLGSSLLQGVGFARDNRLVCSSLDESSNHDLGLPDVVTSYGNEIRTHSTLPMAPETPILTLTSAKGYTAFIHPALIFVVSDEGDNFPAGVVNVSELVPLVSSAPFDVDWPSLGIGQANSQGIVTINDHILAYERSAARDIMGYATVPVTEVWNRFEWLARPYALAGLIAGFLMAYLAHRLAVSRASLPTLLRAGIARGEIFVMYQPIVDLESGRWVGAEALARWQRRSGELVPPDIFIPIAERHDLIGAITGIVTRTALADFGKLTSQGLFISINVSPIDLRTASFAQLLDTACAEEGVDPGMVHLEVTERQDASEPVTAQAAAELRRRGFKVGLDDFGIGYSNLAYLDTLPLDYIKVDRTFVASAGGRGAGGEILDHIIDLARARRLDVIAEGVETEAQRSGLLVRGVGHGQGWLFGRPMTMADFVTTRRKQPPASAPRSARADAAA